MIKEDYDFYCPFNLKLHDLHPKIQYQLDLLESHDLPTRQHSENVANLTYRLCEYLNCKADFTLYATTCAYLHDIGKLFIPIEILAKPGALTDEEFHIMKNHTTMGYDLCYKDLDLRPFAGGALYHHESLDGSGYPNALTKDDIPYMGQIVRVADEYDALVSKRHYKTHISISETLRILIDDATPQNKNATIGKLNPKILKVLFKVVIDDIMYEIACIKEYLEHLENEAERLKLIDNFNNKMLSAKNDKKREYYFNGMKVLFGKGENEKNYKNVLDDYTNIIDKKKFTISKLHDEIKIIKDLRLLL